MIRRVAIAPALMVSVLAVACPGASDGPAYEVLPLDQTSAAICGVSFDDVRDAWDDFAPTHTVTVCAGGACDAATIADGLERACDGSGTDVDVRVGPGLYREALYVSCPGQRLRLGALTPPPDGEALAALPEAERVILDGSDSAATACGVPEHGALQFEGARAVWVEGFELRGYHRACPRATVYGVVVQGGADGLEAVRVRANYIHDIGVACAGGAAACDGDVNGHGVLVIGVDARPLRRVEVADNLLADLALGQSEALAINGHVVRFVVERNVVRDVDNIGIVAIGFENGRPWQAREGLIRANAALDLRCGNPTYVSDRDNDLCPGGQGRWPAAAGIYLDGAHGVCVADNIVRGFDRGLEVASEQGRGDQQASAIALCHNALEGSREHALSYGGACDGGSNGARDVRLVDNVVRCSDENPGCRGVERDAACTEAPICTPGAACGGAAPVGEPLGCP